MKLICVDLFCGGGGTSEGLINAAEELGLEIELIAINHWQTAIATHSANHPQARHICARIEEIRPREVIPGGRVHLLVASPECTHFSLAAGGRPVDDQRRMPAFGVLTWLQELYVDNLIIENVPEFRGWAPLGADGKPLKSRRGETYRAYLQAIVACGYKKVEDRVLCCADYGDATSRKRLFIMATRTGRPTWPEATHSEDGNHGLFVEKQPWRTAEEIIDWTLVGRSVFDPKKPLAAKTLSRIAAGMKKFNGIDVSSFLATQYQPFLRSLRLGNGFVPSDTEDSGQFHTEAAKPFVIGIDHHGGHSECINAVDQPLTTVTSKARHALVNAFIVGAGGPERAGAPRAVDKPLNTVLTRKSLALVQPRIVEGQAFMISAGGPQGKGRSPKSTSRPLPTVLTENHEALIRPFIVTVNHGKKRGAASSENPTSRCHTVDSPLPTVTTHNGYAVVSAYLTKYYGTATGQSIDKPLDTVTTRERFGLVEPRVIDGPACNSSGGELLPLIPLGNGKYLDLRFRMLKSHELAAAMGFRKNYVFTGNQKYIVRQIGNAVPTHTAKALCREHFKRYANKRTTETNSSAS